MYDVWNLVSRNYHRSVTRMLRKDQVAYKRQLPNHRPAADDINTLNADLASITTGQEDKRTRGQERKEVEEVEEEEEEEKSKEGKDETL